MKLILVLLTTSYLFGQSSVVATAKGPNQINLTWKKTAEGIYGYIVEVQSSGDSRYSSFTEIRPIPAATGYTCDPAASWNGVTGCTISDTSGAHVYNPAVNGVPYWVVESQYIDPQDGTPTQFIAAGLKNNTLYTFRIRSYTGNAATTYGSYSTTTSATTANYTLRYVSPTGSDANDGTASDNAHAWLTIQHGSTSIGCGVELIIMGGSYALDSLDLEYNCTSTTKAVILVNPGDTATITSERAAKIGNGYLIEIYGSHCVIDGLASTVSIPGTYDGIVAGSYNALLNIATGPAIVPTSYGGLTISGTNTLLYGSYLHDYGSPYVAQNPAGGGGYPLHITSANNVIWSNHLTRGGHDSLYCSAPCNTNRVLNNIYDGGWGMAFEVQYDGANYNLFEGSVVFDPGYLEAGAYKPAFELSNGYNTVRRTIAVVTMAGFTGTKASGLEVSAYGTAAMNNNNLFYNNVIFGSQSCYFQSHDLGISAYDGDLVQNNICANFTGDATEIYEANATPNAFAYNALYPADTNVTKAMIVWNEDAGGAYQYHQTLTYAEANYGPAFAHLVPFTVPPRFVDTANMDFHLASDSPLRAVGTRVTDTYWPFPTPVNGIVDLGAFLAGSLPAVGTTIGGKITMGGNVRM